MKPLIVLVDADDHRHHRYDSLLQEVFDFHRVCRLDPDDAAFVCADLFLITVHSKTCDGFDFARRLRSHDEFNGAPVVFTSDEASESLMGRVFAEGGDDLLVPRMGREEIVVRLESKIAFWRANRNFFKFGALTLDLKNLRAEFGNRSLELTLTEFKILKKLLRDHPRFVSREALLHAVWPGQFVLKGTLNTHLTNLRKKTKDWEFEIAHMRPHGIGVQVRPSPPSRKVPRDTRDLRPVP